MSTDYEKQLEIRNAELETQLSSVYKELDTWKQGKNQRQTLSLQYDGWSLVGLHHGCNLSKTESTCLLLMVLKKTVILKSMFGRKTGEEVQVREYSYNTRSGSVGRLDAHIQTGSKDKVIVTCIFSKIRALKIVDESYGKDRETIYFRINDEELKKYL